MIETKFKHTDIGLVPEEWEVKTLGQIGSFTKGSGISRAESQTGTIPAIRYGEIYTDHNDYIREFKSYITPQIALNARKIHKGDILFTASGETKEDIGKSVAFIDDFVAYAGGDLIILSPSEDCDPVYMGYITNSKSSQLQKSSKGQGDAVVHIVTDEIKSIEIPFPPLSEQHRIASALMKVDALISNLDKLIQKKQAIKKGAMQELLTGRKRIPGFKGEWKEIKLGNVANVMRGSSPRPIETYLTKSVNGINWIKIGDVSPNAKYIDRTEEKIKTSGVCSSRVVQKGDLILSNSMSFGRPYILKLNGCIHDGWLVIQDYQETYDVDFLYYALGSENTMDQYIAAAAGSSVKNLNKEKVSDVIIDTPTDKNEQRTIAHVLSTMDSDISALETKRDKYRQIKQGMMRDLLTGRIRLAETSDMERKSYTVSVQKNLFDGAIAAEPHPD